MPHIVKLPTDNEEMVINTKEEREALKNEAVKAREDARYEEAARMFKAVLEWDERNQNVKGFADVCGHLSITYRKWADALGDPEHNEEKEEITKYKQEALSYCRRGIDHIEQHPKVPNTKGNISNLYVHMAMAYYDLALMEEGKEQKVAKLELALNSIQKAKKFYAGEPAPLGWLEKDGAKIIFEMGAIQNDEEKIREAWKILSQAIQNINSGASRELAKTDQAEIKLSAWVHGTIITLAYFHYRLGNYPMVKIYCEMVLNPPNASEVRRKEALSLLKKLE